MRATALALFVFLLAACGRPAAQVEPSPTPSPNSSPATSPTANSSSHVFVIVMENHSYSRALEGKYTSQLAAQYPSASDYHAVGSPSLPNYLALTSGSTWGIRDDGYDRLPAGGLGAQVTAAGIDWRAYMAGMSGGCFNIPYPYALKHNPFAYYGGACPAQVVPFTDFATDVKGNVPQFVWIRPGLCPMTVTTAQPRQLTSGCLRPCR